MVTYLFTHHEGRFFLIGSVLMLIGWIVSSFSPCLSNIFFYLSIFFLGFFACQTAIKTTLQEKRLNVDLLMILAALGAIIIDYASEAAMLLFIFSLAERMEDFANSRSTASIEALMSQVPNTANIILSNGSTKEVATDDLQVGMQLLIAKGEQIPIDGIIDRDAQLNEAALTGESIPIHKEKGDEVYAGTLNVGHAFQLTVTKTSNETVFSNIIKMVEEAKNKPNRISKVIDKIESKYVLGVFILLFVFMILLYLTSDLSFQEIFYRGMVFLTVASPCALVASATPATLSAISSASKLGVLAKGGAALEALSQMTTLYSDKTGTLTFGEFRVLDYQDQGNLIKEIVYMEQQSSHPIAEAISQHFKDLDLTSVNTNETVEEIAGVGMKKGQILLGKPSAFKNYQDPHGYRNKVKDQYTYIFAGKNETILSYFCLADQVRPTAKKTIQDFQNHGVTIEMLTGDNEGVAQQVASELGIQDYTSGMMPEDKIKKVTSSQEKEEMVGMIGDGINDAPALAQADIGIAMGSGSSVAMESADIVMVKNDLAKLYQVFQLSHRLNQTIKQNIIFAVSVIVLLAIFNFFGWVSLPLAVVFHEGSTILVILNGLRFLRKT